VSAGIDSDYRIGPLDLLEVSVFQVPDLNKTVQVSSSGMIVLPLVGSIAARGNTVDQLRADIAAKLGAKYLQNPQVSVFVKEAQSQRITIEGAVNKPGIYMTSGRTTLLQGIALAGGLTEIADEKGVVVFRQVGSERRAAKFDFEAIHAGTASDPVLQGGDIVAVDQSGMKATLRVLRATVPVFGVFSPLL
jgi:polysaccharide export outer membrane protein